MKEVLKLALEALTHGGSRAMGQSAVTSHTKAITAIKEALAQPDFEKIADDLQNICDKQALKLGHLEALLAQPEQEPVAYCYVQKGTSVDILTFDDAPDDAVDGTIFPLYTTPPKRPWVGLTEDEIIAVDMYTLRVRGDGYTYARAIEDKLKEKNCV